MGMAEHALILSATKVGSLRSSSYGQPSFNERVQTSKAAAACQRTTRRLAVESKVFFWSEELLEPAHRRNFLFDDMP
jgi:hypothetical protein